MKVAQPGSCFAAAAGETCAVSFEALERVLVAALDAMRAVDPGQVVQRVQQVSGFGPFAAELVMVRGANAADVLPPVLTQAFPIGQVASESTALKVVQLS